MPLIYIRSQSVKLKQKFGYCYDVFLWYHSGMTFVCQAKDVWLNFTSANFIKIWVRYDFADFDPGDFNRKEK